MTNKNRLSKRKPRLPNKFNDHVMDNISQKRNVSDDFDELEAFRVSNEDKGGELGEIGESSKEVVKDGIEFVNDEIYKNAEVSGDMEKNYDKEKSYASKLSSGINDNNELFFIPTGMKENGEKVVLFDEELVKEGIFLMLFGITAALIDVNAAQSKLVLLENFNENYSKCLRLPYKVNAAEGVNAASKGVSTAELVSTAYDPDTVIIKEAPCKIPIWIRLFNIPLEAWSVRGISALASRLGRPIKMDQVTSKMCKNGVGRLGYARVLIEINVEDEFLDKIEINYLDERRKVKSTKWVRVEYTWKPDRCTHCKVFGHSMQRCDAMPKPKPVVNNNIRTNDSNISGSANKEGFFEVRYRKNFNTSKKSWNNTNQGNKKQQSGVNVEFKPKVPSAKQVIDKQKGTENVGGNNGVKSPFKAWNVGKDNVEKLRKSANKYDVLSEDENHIAEDPFIDKRLIVDEFIKKKIQPNCNETKDWTYDMIQYFKYQWEAMKRMEEEDSEEEDVFDSHNQAVNSLIADKVGHKRIVKDVSWVLMGDFNVTLKPEEHSNGSSVLTCDMGEFRDAINSLEVEDLNSTGFQYTWTKSLKNPIPAMLIIPNRIAMRKKSFRFANYIAEKLDFIDTVKSVWDKQIKGCGLGKEGGDFDIPIGVFFGYCLASNKRISFPAAVSIKLGAEVAFRALGVPVRLISAMKARTLDFHGCQGFLASVMDTSLGESNIENLSMLRIR
ncbi:RNA-directed DNA polymerase, eukaryota, reverse transcriptase zinc-binding domain protein [Tanacetum coccineum]|uniref:RNA-directed DNA polymerase, eukaryota, reverse transcriptase zinc-binding domain protein n=1 Tax=Tanacetum coccineum TaxID=301880 RepID=A0ABQ5EK61_9ASTR